MAGWFRRTVGSAVVRLGGRLAQSGFSLAGSGASVDYEGATTGRRLQLWGLSQSGPNSAVMSSMGSLRSRSRELMRNNPWARGGRNTQVANLIGTGITPSWHIPGKPLLAETIRQRWDRWTCVSDADGRHDFYGQQAALGSCVVEAGEGLSRFRPRFASDGLPVPLQIQLLEPDFLDPSRHGIMSNGNYAHMGVEFDKKVGKRTAYWLLPYHPGDSSLMSALASGALQGGMSSPVPADQVLHVGLPDRVGEVRHLPWLSALILRLYDLDGYDDAQLLRQKIASLLVGFRFTDGSSTNTPGVGKGKTAAGQRQIQIEPGTLQDAPLGTSKIEWSNPPGVGADFPEYMKYQLRAIARGMMLTYEQLSGDFSDANFSAARLAITEYRRWAEMIQWQVFVFQFCQPVAVRWMEVGVATGTLPISAADFNANREIYTDIQWSPPKWALIDPVKDITADIMDVRAGFASRSSKIVERGGNPSVVERQTIEDNKRADDGGLVFDSDPRKVSQSGTSQTNQVVDAALSEQQAA